MAKARATANNHRTRVFQVFDGAGIVTSEAYDFKGNLLRSRRDLLPDYKAGGGLAAESRAPTTEPSPAARPTMRSTGRLTVTAPDSSVYRPTYNEANLLDKVEVNLRGAATATPFVTNIDYNAKGQRDADRTTATAPRRPTSTTTHTFRLIHLKTTRPPGLNGLASQLFNDRRSCRTCATPTTRRATSPASKTLRCRPIFHNNEQVEPVCDYTYDAIYRLIEASGREHIGQTAFDFDPPSGNCRDYPFVGLRAHPNDLQALRNYTERYEYDAVGNFEMLHPPGGQRRQLDARATTTTSQPDRTATKKSNRLTSTTVGQRLNFETYTYDAHGNMTAHAAPRR